MPNTKHKIQSFQRAASFIPSTYNEAENTIELIAATEAEVPSYNWDYGRVREVLVMKSDNVRMDRLQNGAQLLDNHSMYGSVRRDVLGVVEEARLDNKQLIVKVRFSGREDLKDFIADVKNGIYQNVSITYRIYKAEITEEEGKLPLLRAVDWEPFEVSFVSVPADYTAGARSQQNNTATNDCEITITRNSKLNNMNRSSEILKLVRAAGLSLDFAQTLIDDENIDIDKARSMIDAEKAKTAGGTNTPTNEPNTPAPAQNEENTRAAQQAERKRSSEILNAVRAAGFGIEYAEELINNANLSVDQARAAIIDKLASEGENKQTRNNGGNMIQVGAEANERFRSAASIGMVLRSGQVQESKLKQEEVLAGRSYQGVSLLRFAAECLERIGIRTAGMSDVEIAKRAITSSGSDFPVVLENVLHKLLLSSYATVPDTWRRFCMVGSVTDFRAHKRLRPGSLSKLDSVGENGELKNKKIDDAKAESITAGTKGNIINISRNMIINDDLGYFSRLTADLGRAAARSIEIDVYALLALNSGNGPTMSDGNPLFHASHGNLVTGAAPSVTAFDSIKQAMAKQKDHSGNDYLDITPSVLVLGVHQSAAADAVNDSMYDPDAANKLQKKNTSYKTFRDLVATARISGNEQYAFADPSILPVLEVAFLNGVQTPYLEQEEAFTQLGMQWRVFTDYGVGAIDWKGAVKNPGA